MNWFKSIILWFKTHNKLIDKEKWLEMYSLLPSEVKKIYCINCWTNLFSAIDTNHDNTITMWEVIKYGGVFTYNIIKTFIKK